jgi:hypothetical protein
MRWRPSARSKRTRCWQGERYPHIINVGTYGQVPTFVTVGPEHPLGRVACRSPNSGDLSRDLVEKGLLAAGGQTNRLEYLAGKGLG